MLYEVLFLVQNSSHKLINPSKAVRKTLPASQHPLSGGSAWKQLEKGYHVDFNSHSAVSLKILTRDKSKMSYVLSEQPARKPVMTSALGRIRENRKREFPHCTACLLSVASWQKCTTSLSFFMYTQHLSHMAMGFCVFQWLFCKHKGPQLRVSFTYCLATDNKHGANK